MSIVAFDLDGIFAKEYHWLGKLFDHHPLIAAKIRDNWMGVLYRPVTPGIIITGRMESDTNSTKRWLRSHRIYYSDIAFNHIGWRFDEIVECKAFWLKHHRVDVYVESEQRIIDRLRDMVPISYVTASEALSKGLLR
jgi:hypothetical protein